MKSSSSRAGARLEANTMNDWSGATAGSTSVTVSALKGSGCGAWYSPRTRAA
jgi:hypothetical protein